MNATTFDVDFVRSHFPQLANARAFFENAGGSLVPVQVIEALNDYVSRLQVQPGGPYPQGREAAERLQATRERLAAMINAGEDEIVIGPSTTVNCYVLAQALRPTLAAGDEIVVTNQDHEANSGAWRRLEPTGITVREWRVDPDSGELDPGELPALLNQRTRLVCFPHVSNIVGSLNDVAAITALVHDAGARVCVDGVAHAPHRAIDVRALGVDFYFFSLYKICGPHLGLLYVAREHLAALANQNHYFHDDSPPWYKLNPGGQQHEVSAAAVGLCDYLDSLHAHHFGAGEVPAHRRMAQLFGLIAEHESRLAGQLLEFVNRRNDLRVVGRTVADPAERVATVSLVPLDSGGGQSSALAERVTRHAVSLDAGHFYAHRLLRDLGVLARHGGVMRAGMFHYNTPAEVARLIAALEEALSS